jgi:hypothetical protein
MVAPGEEVVEDIERGGVVLCTGVRVYVREKMRVSAAKENIIRAIETRSEESDVQEIFEKIKYDGVG